MSKQPHTWGGNTSDGYGSIPREFYRSYSAMGITEGEFVLITNLMSFAWYEDSSPFPTVATLCERMGKSENTVHSRISSLKEKGYLVVVERPGRSNTYDLSPLFEALKDAPKMRTAASNPEPADVDPPQKLGGPPSPTFGGHKDTQPKDTKKEVHPSDEHRAPLPVGSGTLAPPPGKKTAALREKMAAAQSRSPLEALRALERHVVGVGNVQDARAKKRAARRIAKFDRKKPEDYNAQDIELVFMKAWAASGWAGTANRFTVRELGHAKELLATHGGAATAEVVENTILEWPRWKAELGANGFPSMVFIYAFRASLFPMVLNRDVDASPPEKFGTKFVPDPEVKDIGGVKMGNL